MRIIYYCFLYLTVLFSSSYNCESTTENTAKLLETYRNYINASHDLDKSDRMMMKVWTSDFLLQMVNITSHYRLDMSRHKERNFMSIKANPKWKECMNLHQNEVNKAEMAYYDEESKCVKTANEEGDQKKQSVVQIEKEIRKWRKSYRYLSNQCNKNHPSEDEAAGKCLVEYMQKDKYHITFQRLILLKLESMSSLYNQILASLGTLEVCLKTVLSRYLSNVRLVMGNLNHCYNIRTLSE
ncbi:uncharacterized protein LOC120626809 [Pararge aegeria]|uniref:Jg748 protein n=1 Tax=Pararge aegeria aegeria TaxID=348720 RepID=A0A8S4S2T7_9NEOP|nr:uncharacterized protein LOC120626809 [Pararge aegeria]CAH2247554.1 jg748 [Pararge aegeria aegeria]